MTYVRTPSPMLGDKPFVNCKCSDCCNNPTDSHGIHVIGGYSIPSVLTKRRGYVMEPYIQYRWNSGVSQRAVFPFAQHDDGRRNII